MKCPICEKPVQKNDNECPHCSALLSQWKTMRNSGETLRQRGLVCVVQKDYIGALVSFLESTLTNPLDEKAYLDVARMLFLTGQRDAADRFLASVAASRPSCKDGAESFRRVIAEIPANQPPTTKAPPPPKHAPPPPPQATVPPPPPIPEAKPEPQSEPKKPSRRPLLAMGECVQTYRKSPKKFRNSPPESWGRILDKEQMAEHDWTGMPDPVVGVMQQFRKELNGAFDYVMGLGFWQQGEDDAARTSFRRCIEQLPPVVNPYAYLICLNLNDPKKLDTLLVEFEGKNHFYGRDPLDDFLETLEKHLASWENPDLHKVLTETKRRRKGR